MHAADLRLFVAEIEMIVSHTLHCGCEVVLLCPLLSSCICVFAIGQCLEAAVALRIGCSVNFRRDGAAALVFQSRSVRVNYGTIVGKTT